ncbi:MAG TPA: hypothetical protein VGC81_03095 [Candidatus Methylomirabilis sp.]
MPRRSGEIIESILSHHKQSLTAWEIDFLNSILDQFEIPDHDWVTARQLAVLEDTFGMLPPDPEEGEQSAPTPPGGRPRRGFYVD